MVIVADQDAAGQELASSSMRCPSCSGGSLRPWGHARTRVLRGLHGARHTLRPRRARCRDCGATHVLLPCHAPPRRADTLQVVMTGLLAHQGGAGARTIAADLGVPVDTVRSWVRSVSALGHAAAATARRVPRPLTAWQLIGLISAGCLLAPVASTLSG